MTPAKPVLCTGAAAIGPGSGGQRVPVYSSRPFSRPSPTDKLDTLADKTLAASPAARDLYAATREYAAMLTGRQILVVQ